MKIKYGTTNYDLSNYKRQVKIFSDDGSVFYNPKYMNAKMAAQKLGISISTLYRLENDKESYIRKVEKDDEINECSYVSESINYESKRLNILRRKFRLKQKKV